MAYPIWQDLFLSVPDNNLFRVSKNGTVIFQGKARAAAGLSAQVRMNTICAPAMDYGSPAFRAKQRNAICLPQTFVMERSTNGTTWTTIGTVDFIPDWSYETVRQNATNKNAPINDHFAYRQVLFVSQTNATSINPRYRNGSTWTNTGAVSMTGGGTLSWPLYGPCSAQTQAVEMGSFGWYTPKHCAPAALYYRNAYGGWDAFLIEGNILPSEDYQRHTRRTIVDNSGNPNVINRGEWNYATERTLRWVLNTGALNDAESVALSQHLLPSNDVWLHDFDANRVYPVIIDDGSQRVNKYYRTIGRQVVTYQISCHLAQDRVSQ